MRFTSQNVCIHTTDVAFMCSTPLIFHSYRKKMEQAANENHYNNHLFCVKLWINELCSIMKSLSREEHDEVVDYYNKIWNSPEA